MTTPQDIVTIARSTSGPATSASGAAAIFAVIGTAAVGDVATPHLVTNDSDPTTLHTGGPVVEVAEIVSSYSRQATIPVRATSAVAGAYDTIDDGEFTGTAIPTVATAVVPYIDAEVYIDFPAGGTVGTAGITYRTSIDGGRTLSAETALGTASYIDVPIANARILLEPPSAQVTALVTYVNAIRTAALAHFPYITGSVHGSADTTSDDGVAAACTNVATGITLTGTLITALGLHFARGSTVHLTADITTSLAAATAAQAVAVANATAQNLITVALLLETALEAHEADTDYHTAADATNVVSAAQPTRGTVVADDVVQVETTAPTLNAAGLTAAFTALAAFKSVFGGVVVAGSFDPSVLWSALIAGLDELRANQIPVIALVEARGPADGETAAQYRIALTAEWLAYQDERVHVVAGRGRFDPTTLARTRAQLKRSHLAPLGARLAALDYGESPGVTKIIARDIARPSAFGGPLDGFSIYSSTGALIGHDERINPGLHAAGFGVTTSYRRAQDPQTPYVFQPKNKASAGNRAPHIAHQRVVTVVEGIIYQVGTEEIESRLLYEPGRDTIRGDVADALDAQLSNRILAEVGDPSISLAARISRLLVQVDRNAVIDPDDPIVPINVEVDTAFYVSAFSVRLQVNRS